MVQVGQSFMEIHPIFFGKSYGYFPRSPLSAGLDQLSELAKKHRLIFFRMDPEKESDVPENFFWNYGTSPQPEATILLDLLKNEDELLRQMKRKGRYNIALAIKRGVAAKRGETTSQKNDFVLQFHALLLATTVRDKFSGHDVAFYQKFLEIIPKSEIFVVSHNGVPLAAAIGVIHEDTFIYYYGASSHDRKELMAPYLLQWEMIRFAKNQGSRWYDFFGISPINSSKNHPWQGVTEFKKKFGGVLKIYPKPKDIIMSPLWYKIYQLAKFARSVF